MGIFQHDDGTRLIEDVHADHHSHVRQQVEWVVVKWTVVGDQPVRVAILRSERRHADVLEDLLERDALQTLVYVGDETVFQDQTVDPDVEYHYTVFAKAADGAWHKQHHFTVKTAAYDDGRLHLMSLEADYLRSYHAVPVQAWPGLSDDVMDELFPGRERWPGREDAD